MPFSVYLGALGMAGINERHPDIDPEAVIPVPAPRLILQSQN
jgi:hypothetical protein